ncbi:hypothetical protein SEA_MISCHIEF19_78 [Streptomyces phage Mischief19]|nr:hypothetical protein SEA_MISCHIEF19_78 [Streptomyces phage Mischief19]
MGVTFHTAELSARTATHALASAGADRVGEVLLPTNLIGLARLVNKVYQGTEAMQITANLTETVKGIVEWQRDMGITVVALRRPDVMNTAAAATAAVNVGGGDEATAIGSRARGLAISRNKIALDKLICHANGLHPHAAAYVSEGYWQLVKAEPHRVGALLFSVEGERFGDVCKALVEYAAAAKRKIARDEFDADEAPVDAQAEAAKDEAAADAEHYGF